MINQPQSDDSLILSYRVRQMQLKMQKMENQMNENEVEKHEMKLIVEETLAKYKNNEGNIYESEVKRVEL